ncbi:zinc-dependent alcohol dehydrogenase [Rhodococcus sp. IEGM 1330]|uniref:zinc-dependent alcohol dehydrogenase n=1 Tax=Rhodococcus sp. IEGM 1330 TaxID=3082225 RepID=UPI0029549850|nr:alcohol dehydrogenase catalytic domain-containing protein [Rhodococcus sp. IEGM 1330]MDV8023766.1 alcohol dehydrogenase catalytic domain-containing protein [Rhodococcus sp. IEGM 1330]
MRAAVIDAPHSVSIVELDAPVCGPDDVVVAISYVGLCGTDLELLHGTSSYLTDGKTTFPHHFGHEWVGVVDRTGSGVRDLETGDAVTGSTMLFCQSCTACGSGKRNQCSDLKEVGLYEHGGAAAQFLVMPRRAVVSLGRVPAEPEHVLIEPLVTVLEALDAASVSPGDRVLVIGAGTIGSLAVAMLSRCPVFVDVLEPRCIEHLGSGAVAQRFTTADSLTGTYDIVVEASGGAGALSTAIGALRPGGKCILVGVAAHSESIDPGMVALAGISIIGIRHGVDHYRRAAALFPLIRPALAALIDSVVPLSDAKAAFDRLESRRTRPKVVIAVE